MCLLKATLLLNAILVSHWLLHASSLIGNICPLAISCNNLSDPSNGLVTISGTSLGSTAQYTCNYGYVLVGDAIRTCERSGEWSETEPVCERKY